MPPDPLHNSPWNPTERIWRIIKQWNFWRKVDLESQDTKKNRPHGILVGMSFKVWSIWLVATFHHLACPATAWHGRGRENNIAIAHISLSPVQHLFTPRNLWWKAISCGEESQDLESAGFWYFLAF